MLPDFDRLTKPSTAIAGHFSSERTLCEASQQIKSFFVQYFSEKVLHSSSKVMGFCGKSMNNAAQTHDFLATSRQNTALQTAANAVLTPAVVPERDGIVQFFDLWLAQPSWSPIILTQRGWQTVINPSGKKVPLVLGTIESHYRRAVAILGKRFGRLTNYLMIDVDINSPFHPRNGGLKPILDAMDALGLCRYLLVRSSASGGLHIYFPLAEPVSSWGLACAAHAALTAHGVEIIGGQCELFPNKKSFNAEHNGHRLPLQNGSFLLDDDFSCISNEKACFVNYWKTAATHQDNETLLLALAGKVVFTPVPITPTVAPPPPVAVPQVRHAPTTRTAHVIPPIAWTRFGQSNDIMRELVNYGDRYVGLKTVADLAAWVKAVAPQLPGYQQFASPKSKRDIEYGNWPIRWSTSHFDKAWQYKVGGSDHNANVARDAKWRIFAALERVCVDVNIKTTALKDCISSVAKNCFNKGVGWKTFKKHEDEIWACIKRAGDSTPSIGFSEDVDSFSELPVAQNIEPEFSGKRGYTQLSTLRCVVGIYSSVLASLSTSKNGADPGGSRVVKTATDLPSESGASQPALPAAAKSAIEPVNSRAEGIGIAAAVPLSGFSVGQAVRVVMPGGSLDGIAAQVLAQTLDVLGQPVYQLDAQRQGQAVTLPAECLQAIAAEDRDLPGETVIRATAAQLVRVLGQACPFVGPGLWTVKRDEVPAKAWGQLRRLVGEM